MSHRFGTYKTLASTLESDMLKNLKFIWNHSRKTIKKKIVKERWLETVYDYNYNVAIAFSGVNGELVPRFLTSVDSGLLSKVLLLYWPNVCTWRSNDDVVTLVGPKFMPFFSFFYTNYEIVPVDSNLLDHLNKLSWDSWIISDVTTHKIRKKLCSATTGST